MISHPQQALVLILILMTCVSTKESLSLSSNVKTQKQYIENTINPNIIYTIDLQKIATNKQEETNKCTVQQKEIKTYTQHQKFRVGPSGEGKTSVYQSLTQLQDRQDGIDSFKILGDHIMVIMMNGSAYFLKNNREAQTNLTPVDIKISLKYDKFRFIPNIAPIGGNAFVATPREVSFCEPKINKCTKLKDFKQVEGIINFQAYQYKGKQYLFFMTGQTMTTYEVSTNAILFNEKIYKADYFKKEKVHLQQIIPISNDRLILLDFYSGLIQLQHSTNSIAEIKNVTGPVYEQFGCRSMTSQKQGKYVVLKCSLTQKTSFILQLVREKDTGLYSPQQPIFFNQVLKDLDTNSQIIMANIFSGVRLYWSSTSIEAPYPTDYQIAGSIFLHNAKGSQLWTMNDRKVIYIFTQDELRIYELSVKNPEIDCFSLTGIKQEYRVKYTYLCVQQNNPFLKICSTDKKFNYEAIQIKQVEFKTTLLPLIVSAVLVVSVGFLLIKLYKRYDQEIQNARQKYNVQNDQFAIEG